MEVVVAAVVVEKVERYVKGLLAVLVTVTAPVAPETEMPDPARSEVTPEFVIWRDPPRTERVELSSDIPVPAETVPVATEPMAPAVFPKRTWPPVKDVAPVPPFATPKVPEIVESVVVATHDGMPLTRASTNPLVDDATCPRTVADFAYKMSPGVYEVMLVPP